MVASPSDVEALPAELRELVKWSVGQLGRVIESEAGKVLYARIEALRADMAQLRGKRPDVVRETLERNLTLLEGLGAPHQLIIARSFALMLELMNAAENAYRSHRLHLRRREPRGDPAPVTSSPQSRAIIYVLTAHPTEARSPQNIAVFHSLQKILFEALGGERARKRLEGALYHKLKVAWRVSIVRERSPRVKDEAEHIYSTFLAPEILDSLLDASTEVVPVYVRSWVGGDKDGHPGVDEKTMLESLTLSRAHLLRYVRQLLGQIHESVGLLPGRPLHSRLASANKLLGPLQKLAVSDGRKVEAFRRLTHTLAREYTTLIGVPHPALRRLKQLLHVFPGLVVPLELRESSDVLVSSPAPGRKLAIDRMLRLLARTAQGGNPRWYARGFIVSMTQELSHLQIAERKVVAALGSARIPVIPLFEQAKSLRESSNMVRAMMKDRRIGRDAREEWDGLLELMMGYSDSSKESGAFPSRLAIAKGMALLDEACRKENIRPLFFQGSGGSVDRGGGRVQEQTAWWPRSALEIFKVTVQGEMVERSFSSPEITRGQIERIHQSVSEVLEKGPARAPSAVLEKFADAVAARYRKMVHTPSFLEVVKHATPYPDLRELKIGSRPSRRTTELSVEGLRAIPWVLCWTQTRVLFQTWWGLGSAWRASGPKDQAALKRAFAQEPIFSSFIHALGFTLAKVELDVWKVYLAHSGLEPATILEFDQLFTDELAATREFLTSVSGQTDPLWFRPWLGASIRLRSPMIHPLNLLQLLAIRNRDMRLLRHTVTGIATGMLTTG